MIKEFSPAKVNLFLHVTGKQDDGYHTLESLVTFSSFGDWITVDPDKEFSLKITGPYASLTPQNNNIVERAAHRLAALTNNTLNLSITIEKNIPVGAGLGGGSSNAAAMLRALIQIWEVDLSPNMLKPLLLELGADVPLCFAQKTALISGVGEIINPLTIPKNLYAVMIYPNKHCSTADIFHTFDQGFSSSLEGSLKDWNNNFLETLKMVRNDLTFPAIKNIPDIKSILDVLNAHKDCILSRMTGSGSCCFGLFKTKSQAQDAANTLSNKNPQWWIKAVILNPTL